MNNNSNNNDNNNNNNNNNKDKVATDAKISCNRVLDYWILVFPSPHLLDHNLYLVVTLAVLM